MFVFKIIYPALLLILPLFGILMKVIYLNNSPSGECLVERGRAGKGRSCRLYRGGKRVVLGEGRG
jgi:hypothetical protein